MALFGASGSGIDFSIMSTELGDVIATRKLYRLDDPGAAIIIKFGKPQRTPGHDDFFCPTQIVGIGDERVESTYGIDAVQALQLAMKWMGASLVRLNAEVGNTLRWEGDENGSYGLPTL